MRHVFLSMVIILGSFLYADSSWQTKADVRFNLSQTAYDNWKDGGENTWIWQLGFLGSHDQIKPETNWKNSLKVNYGQSRQGSEEIRKSSDELRFISVYSWKKSNVYAAFNLLSQISEGKDYSGLTPALVSFAFDPLYLTESLGYETLLLNAITTRVGVALKQTIANKTSLTSSKSEFGVEFVTEFAHKLTETVSYATTLQLFSQLKSVDQIDVYWDNDVKGKLTSDLNWIFNINLKYNKDVSSIVQLKQTFALQYLFSLI
ncbi:MAG: DUF3078 domain-containing protein [Candidatus Margulisbacteria bacterium]|nr:DUF3078 domain-containing protein [Candidatus Margulisiibacteriota bacterium]